MTECEICGSLLGEGMWLRHSIWHDDLVLKEKAS